MLSKDENCKKHWVFSISCWEWRNKNVDSCGAASQPIPWFSNIKICFLFKNMLQKIKTKKTHAEKGHQEKKKHNTDTPPSIHRVRIILGKFDTIPAHVTIRIQKYNFSKGALRLKWRKILQARFDEKRIQKLMPHHYICWHFPQVRSLQGFWEA